jgi:hypothetical protein
MSDNTLGFIVVILFMYSVMTTLALLMIYYDNQRKQKLDAIMEKEKLQIDIETLKAKIDILSRMRCEK